MRTFSIDCFLVTFIWAKHTLKKSQHNFSVFFYQKVIRQPKNLTMKLPIILSLFTRLPISKIRNFFRIYLEELNCRCRKQMDSLHIKKDRRLIFLLFHIQNVPPCVRKKKKSRQINQNIK